MKRKSDVDESSSQLLKKAKASDDVHEEVRILYANEDPLCIEEQKKWKRNSLSDFDPRKDALIVQQVDCDYSVVNLDRSSPVAKQIGSKEPSVPVIRLFGITQSGHSALVHVHGYLPYFYVPVPMAKLPQGVNHEVCANFRAALNNALKPRVKKDSEKVNEYVQMIEIEEKMSVMGYHGTNKVPFFKIVLSIPSHTPTARTILEEGLNVPGLGNISYRTFESNIPFVLRFMVDQDIAGGQWIKIPAGKFYPVSHSSASATTQIEVEAAYEDLQSLPVDSEEWAHIAPLRILSFDIECAGRPGIFPEAKTDPVIQIANLVTVQGQDKPIIKNIFVLGKCSPIVGADVRCFKTEVELLRGWRDFVIESDPDVITGYNILNFDIPYLIDRAAALKVDKFEYLSRLISQKSKIKDTKFSSNQMGTRESKEIAMYGRVVMDMLQVVQRDHKLSSYTLNNVSSHFLAQQKEDVHHSIISQLHNGSNDDRRRLAVYCLKDAYLPQRLLDKLMAMVNYIEMARVTGVPFSYLLSRGQGIKVMSQMLRRCRLEGLVVPTWRSPPQAEGYEGATVIEPKKGYYDRPVATLDFASLYPSIMMAHNLCYTTLLNKGEVEKLGLSKDDYEVTPTGGTLSTLPDDVDHFVKASVRKGLLPRILESLLSARSHAKKLMAKETDKFKQQVYNGRQLALKITANSVYGFTGQSVGQLPCLEISSSVTAYGRDMINLTKQSVEAEYRVENGYKHDAEVIYGDTDSVMVLFGPDKVEDTMKLGREAAKLVTSKFPKPISLEFEKVYFPYLLMSKKRYAGLFWTKPDKWDKLDAKGIESVRRDNCGLVRYVIDTNLRKILIERDIKGSIEFTKNMIRDLLQNKVDLSLLIITKQLKDDYTNPQPHAVLAERMRKRDAATAPNVGDRVPYVIIRGDKSAKMYEKAEDPLYVLEHSIAVDSQYYLENQLSKPLTRIFQAIMDNPNALLTGEHTRVISVPTPKSGGIVGFTKVKETCLGCRAPLKTNEKGLCGHCMNNAPGIYHSFLSKVRTKEMEYSRLWTQCQNCQGSFHQEVLCTAADCPIFYMRTKVKKELTENRATLDKFSDLTW